MTKISRFMIRLAIEIAFDQINKIKKMLKEMEIKLDKIESELNE